MESSRDTLHGQQGQWETSFTNREDMFGDMPSAAAVRASAYLKANEKREVLELGAGQGRDTLYLARQGFEMHVLDYSHAGVAQIRAKAEMQGLTDQVSVMQHDVRQAFPLSDGSVDACYSHMLYCMAFTMEEIKQVHEHVHRVLRPGGINIYTVRHTGDPHYGHGIHRGEDMYEVGGFIVHFFSEETVRTLTQGYRLLDIHTFEEGGLPRRLFQVTLQKL